MLQTKQMYDQSATKNWLRKREDVAVQASSFSVRGQDRLNDTLLISSLVVKKAAIVEEVARCRRLKAFCMPCCATILLLLQTCFTSV